MRCQELSINLEKLQTEKIVRLSEDATAITPKNNYDAITNTLTGLIPPIDAKTGCPILFTFPRTTWSGKYCFRVKNLRPKNDHFNVFLVPRSENNYFFYQIIVVSPLFHCPSNIFQIWGGRGHEDHELIRFWAKFIKNGLDMRLISVKWYLLANIMAFVSKNCIRFEKMKGNPATILRCVLFFICNIHNW